MSFKVHHRHRAGLSLPVQSASAVYIQLAKDASRAEDARKASLEQRGSWISASSTGLAGVVFALATFAGNIGRVHFSGPAEFGSVASILLFVAAAGLGVACSWPRSYNQIPTSELKRFAAPIFWEAPPSAAEQRIFQAEIGALEISRHNNQLKAKFLIAAMCAQVCAIGIWAVATCVVFS